MPPERRAGGEREHDRRPLGEPGSAAGRTPARRSATRPSPSTGVATSSLRHLHAPDRCARAGARVTRAIPHDRLRGARTADTLWATSAHLNCKGILNPAGIEMPTKPTWTEEAPSKPDPGVAVRRVGDLAPLRRSGRDEDRGRAGDRAGRAPVDVRHLQWDNAARVLAQPTARAIASAPVDYPGMTQAARQPWRPLRRHPRVPGRRQRVHRAVLRGDRRTGRRSRRRPRTARIASRVTGSR